MSNQNLVTEVMQVLDDRYYPYDHDVVEEIVNHSLDAKRNLIKLFSKHPLWNPEKFMIVFDQDYTRDVNRTKMRHFLDRYYNSYLMTKIRLMDISYDDYEYHTKVLTELNKLVDNSGQYLDSSLDNFIENLNALNDDFKLRNNMKLSKAVRKICSVMGWDKFDGFEKAYAEFADAVNPIKVKRHTVISLNPIDFLLMSNGTNWHSCHDIGNEPENAGCYSSGTISYMLDEHSFLFYTVDSEYDGDAIELEPKITREVFGYNEGNIAQLRLYPSSKDYGSEEEYQNVREIVQQVVADCLGENNLWTKRRKSVEDFIKHGKDATCYPDWQEGNPGSSHCVVSTLNKYFNPEIRNNVFTFGARPVCINCGECHDNDDNILCQDCYDDAKLCCESCGCHLPSENDRIWIGDDCYCENCVQQCDCCDEYVLEGDLEDIDGEWICDDCINSNDYHKCEYCGDIHNADNMYNHYGEWLCEDCYMEVLEDEDENEDEM